MVLRVFAVLPMLAAAACVLVAGQIGSGGNHTLSVMDLSYSVQITDKDTKVRREGTTNQSISQLKGRVQLKVESCLMLPTRFSGTSWKG